MIRNCTAALLAASAMISLAPQCAQARTPAHHRHAVHGHAHGTGSRVRPANAPVRGTHLHPRPVPARWTSSAGMPRNLADAAEWLGQTGTASYYSTAYNGHRATSGRISIRMS